MLQLFHLVKTFAGLVVTDGVSLDVAGGHIHALIGPNGAGKSTLVNQISGTLGPTAGRILLGGKDITGLSAAARVRCGISRTFQVSTLLDDFSVAGNIGMAVQARRGGNARILDSLRARRDVWDEVDAILETSRLGAFRDQRAGTLSSGWRKQLELVMALAGRPSLLLLDEPMAGLSNVENQDMIEALAALRGKLTILLVEHDMDAVFALADQITVLVYGRVMLTGNAQDIRSSHAVRTAYLGGEEQLANR